MTKVLACPFCRIAERVIRKGLLVTDSHSAVIPTRHIQSFFDLTEAERSAALLMLLDISKVKLDAAFSPAAYNTRINEGWGEMDSADKCGLLELIVSVPKMNLCVSGKWIYTKECYKLE